MHVQLYSVVIVREKGFYPTYLENGDFAIFQSEVQALDFMGSLKLEFPESDYHIVEDMVDLPFIKI